MSQVSEINAILDGLGEAASYDEVEFALRDYGKREVLMVLADRSLAAGGGGGGGGSQPSAEFSLTAQQLKDSTLTPHTIIPAQGAGTLIVPTMYVFNFEAGATPFNSSSLELVIGDFNANTLTTFLDEGADFTGWTLGAAGGGVFVGWAEGGDPADYLNQPVRLRASLRGSIAAVGFGQANPGTGYAVGDTGTVDDGSPNAAYVVTEIDGGSPGGDGGVSEYTITDGGDGYILGPSGASTEWTTTPGGAQPGTGAGLTVQVTAVDASDSAGDGTLSGIVYYLVADLS